MLVLSRNVGQSIHIGDDIVVRVVGVQGNQVKLGFTAPDDVKILREELVPEKPSRNIEVLKQFKRGMHDG